jgi:hypothetical protein
LAPSRSSSEKSTRRSPVLLSPMMAPSSIELFSHLD